MNAYQINWFFTSYFLAFIDDAFSLYTQAEPPVKLPIGYVVLFHAHTFKEQCIHVSFTFTGIGQL